MNDFYKVFPKSHTLLCHYHIFKNVRAICKLDVTEKVLKFKDKKIIKAIKVWKNVIDV